MASHNDEERGLVESFEREEWQSAPEKEQKLLFYQQIASATFKKDKRISVRLSSKALMEY